MESEKKERTIHGWPPHLHITLTWSAIPFHVPYDPILAQIHVTKRTQWRMCSQNLKVHGLHRTIHRRMSTVMTSHLDAFGNVHIFCLVVLSNLYLRFPNYSGKPATPSPRIRIPSSYMTFPAAPPSVHLPQSPAVRSIVYIYPTFPPRVQSLLGCISTALSEHA